MSCTACGTRIKCLSTCLLFLAGLSLFPCYSQDFGGFKPGIRWQQINSPVVRVIYPAGLEPQARRVANNILFLNENNHSSIGQLSKKLDLILNNQGVISNGYVTLMPYRSEFFTTPSQDGFSIGTSPWLDLLSVHEYRHALQYINMRQGFTKLAWWLTGEAGWGAMINLTAPAWFFEGDAVATETALTNQGRGRMPSFLQQYKSILLSNRHYSYMKARNGSYRDIVPNEYELGYLLCSYGREKYGNDLWTHVITRTAWLHGLIYPFSNAVRHYTGMNTRKFYSTAMAGYKKTWAEESALTPVTPFTRLPAPSKKVTDFRFPVYLNNGDLMVYRESYDQPGAIWRISPDGKQEKICTTGISTDPCFTASGNRLAWSEVTWNIRYSAENYSDVVIYYLDTGRKIYLTHGKRYFSPALSPEGNRIVVTEVDPAGSSRLRILDSRTGEVISSLPNPDNLFYTYPKWDTDGNGLISSARTPSGNMLIIRQSISSGRITKLSAEYNQIIGEVLVTPGIILFTSGFTGVYNIHSLTLSDGSIRQLTSSRFGAYYPALSPDGRFLTYSDFSVTGHGLVSARMDSLLNRRIDPEEQDSFKMFDFSYFQKEGGNILDKIPDHPLESGPFQQWKNPVRIHSWNLSPGVYSMGISMISDNTLSNLHIEAGFDYYYNEGVPGFNAKVQYGGIFPVLTAGISRQFRHPEFLDYLAKRERDRPISLDNLISFQVQVPLNLTRGFTFRQMDLSMGYSFISVKNLTGKDVLATNPWIVNAITGHAHFSSARKKALQNITTPLGFSLELSANQSVTSARAEQYQAIGDFAIRGLQPNHSLVLSAGWKWEPNRNPYHFLDLFLYPRGFGIPLYDRMLTFQGSYHLPLAYPDLGFGGIFYCSRVRASVFADYGYATIADSTGRLSHKQLASVGTELILDTRWFNIADIPLGIRFSLHLPPKKGEFWRRSLFEFIIPVLRL